MKFSTPCAAIGALTMALPLMAAAAPAGGMPSQARTGLATAATHAGMTVPVAPPTAAPTRSATTATASTRVRSATGQPSASCESTGAVTPGQSASAPGSAFNPDGKAGTVYAGEQPQNSNNPKSVSQYDIACLRPNR